MPTISERHEWDILHKPYDEFEVIIMPRKIKENHSPHVQFDKDVVCRAFSEILSREHGREIVCTLVKKNQPAEDAPSVSNT